MMRGVILLLTVALAVGGCSAQSGGGGAPQPTKACGGFHVIIANVGSSAVEVRFNAIRITEVQPHESADIPQWGQYAVPSMPWDVEVVRTSDGTVLLSAHEVDDGTDGRRFEVASSPISADAFTPFVC
jgi:hypothetical protein